MYQVIKSHRFGGMSNNSGQKAKIEGKNEQTFGASTRKVSCQRSKKLLNGKENLTEGVG